METIDVCSSGQLTDDFGLPPTPELIEVAKKLAAIGRNHDLWHDKIPADMRVLEVDPAGAVRLELRGRYLTELDHACLAFQELWPLRLQQYRGPLEPKAVFGSVAGAVRNIGGGPFNINATLSLLAAALHRMPDPPAALRLTINTPGDRLTAMMPPELADEVRDHVQCLPIPLPERLALHLARDAESRATLLVTSPPVEVAPVLEAHLRQNARLRDAYQRARVIVSSDSVEQAVERVGLSLAGKTFVATPPTALLKRVIIAALPHGTIVPLNAREAMAAWAHLLATGCVRPPRRAPAFTSPIGRDRRDTEALEALDSGLAVILSAQPSPSTDQARFVCPFTFGAEGGMMVAQGDPDLACATSIPSAEGAVHLAPYLDDVLVAPELRPTDAGAGDGTASMVVAFNAIDPRLFIERQRGARTLKRTQARVAGLLFASVMARLVSSAIVATARTFAPISPKRMASLLDHVARSAIDAVLNPGSGPHRSKRYRLQTWGIDALVWRAGSIGR